MGKARTNFDGWTVTFMTLFHTSWGTFNVIHHFFDIQALVDSIRKSVTKIVTIPSQREPLTRLNPSSQEQL